MSVMDCGGKGRMVRDESVEEERGTFSEIELGDGDLLACGESAEMDRGLYQPCSARNLARISRARRRPASASSGLGGGTEGLVRTAFSGLGG